MIKLKRLDLTLGEGHYHPDFIQGHDYLIVRNNSSVHFGKADKVHFGWTFYVGWHLQYDKPGTNSSKITDIYEVIFEQERKS